MVWRDRGRTGENNDTSGRSTSGGAPRARLPMRGRASVCQVPWGAGAGGGGGPAGTAGIQTHTYLPPEQGAQVGPEPVGDRLIAPGGRVAAHPRVDHAIGVAFAREARLETRRIGLVGGDAEAGSEAVPEGDDDRIGARGRGPRDEPRDQHAERDARDEAAHFASVV